MAASLEKRVTALEAELHELKKKFDTRPWWEKVSGTFANDPAFQEAMRLGREYRESLRPKPKKRKKGSGGNGRSRH